METRLGRAGRSSPTGAGHISWRSGLNPMTLANSYTRGCAEGAHLERSVIVMRRLFETSCLAAMVIIGAAAQRGGFAIA